MSIYVKSNKSVKEVVTPDDRSGYIKLYGSISSFWSTTITLKDNIYKYSRIVIVGKNGTDEAFSYFNFNYDIIPEVSVFAASQIILVNNNNMTNALMAIRNCSSSSNNVLISGQFRKNDKENSAMSISAIYGIK